MQGVIELIIEQGIVNVKGGLGMFLLTKDDTTIDVVHKMIKFV